MTRLVIVSPTTTMSSGLSAAGFQVVRVRPDAFEAGLGSGADVDAFVLDLGSAHLARSTVVRLRSRVALVPILLIAGDEPGWDTLELRELPAIRVLPPSADIAALLPALQALAVEPTTTPLRQRDAVYDALSELTREPHDALSEDDDLDALISAVPPLEQEPADRPRHARDDRSI